MKYSSSQATRQGGRELNEDRCVHSHTQEACLFAVADGMGGHPEGEVAAQIAVDTFSNLFGKQARPSLSDPMQFLADALLQAHQQILRYAIQKKLKDSPRTTLVAALAQDGKAHWIHCGDSRLYFARGGHLVTRTRDHSYIEQKNAGIIHTTLTNRNILFSCLGSPTKPIFDQGDPVALRPGDRLLLCSDGLWDNLDDNTIVQELGGQALDKAVPKMVEMALRAGGSRCDNVTVLAMEWMRQGSEPPTVAMPLSKAKGKSGSGTAVKHATGPVNISEANLDEAEIARSIAQINQAIKRASARKP